VQSGFIRTSIEQREKDTLSQHACCAADSQGREVAEELDPIRTCFQRDRDRILHSKPFRRLKHKTQVFIAPEGDHYRTRLTHTLEVAQVARTIGRALRLNEDLIEAIALGHDAGHPPFGHAGEQALDEVVREYHSSFAKGPIEFRHYDQSLRVLQTLGGLNLTHEVIAGIGGHSKGEKDLTTHDGEPTSTLEAAVVRISDRIAYVNHDLDDALRSGIITQVPSEFGDLGDTHGTRISRMVIDVVENSLDQPAIRLSPAMLETMNAIKNWMFEHVYFRYPQVMPDLGKAQGIVKELFWHYVLVENLESQDAIDYVAGMTDRFAIHQFEQLRIPQRFWAVP
jgi:dGTPase